MPQCANPDRRHVLKSGAGILAGATLPMSLPAWAATPLMFRFGHTGSFKEGVEEAIKGTARQGFPGYEPGRGGVMKYLDRPLELKKLFEESGVIMASCSNEGPNFSTDWLDPDKIPQTIKDHVEFARDFIHPIGQSDHFKLVPTRGRPEGGPTDDQLKRMSDAWNEAGRQTIAFGIRFAPHNHVGTSFYLEHEFRRVMELTDPRYVWLTADTSHFALGGLNPEKIISEFLPRIAEVHYKDAPAEYRSGKLILNEPSGIPYFRNLGTGGVDFPAVHQVLIRKKYNGWVCLDIDGGMTKSYSNDMEATLKGNKEYLINVLHVDPKTV